VKVLDPDGNTVLLGQREPSASQPPAADDGATVRFSLLREAAALVSARGGIGHQCQVRDRQGRPCPNRAEVKLADSMGDRAWVCLVHADEILVTVRRPSLPARTARGSLHSCLAPSADEAARLDEGGTDTDAPQRRPFYKPADEAPSGDHHRRPDGDAASQRGGCQEDPRRNAAAGAGQRGKADQAEPARQVRSRKRQPGGQACAAGPAPGPASVQRPARRGRHPGRGAGLGERRGRGIRSLTAPGPGRS